MTIGHDSSLAVSGLEKQRTPTSLLVVGTPGAFAEALTRLLSGSGVRVVHIAGEEVGRSFRQHRPTVLLLDGRLGDARLVEWIAFGRQYCSGIRVVLLSGDKHQELTTKLDIDVVLSAWSSREDLLSAIRGTDHSGRLGRRVRSRLGHGRGVLSQLTPREIQILQTLMIGVSNAEIARRLTISPHTVRTHIQNVFCKLGASSRLEIITLGFRHGLHPLEDVGVEEG
ncbi:MAG: response regulator transcription factor [Egibacteraceae bacterium]